MTAESAKNSKKNSLVAKYIKIPLWEFYFGLAAMFLTGLDFGFIGMALALIWGE